MRISRGFCILSAVYQLALHLADEKLFYQTQALGGAQNCQRRQEVAVSKGALDDVVCLGTSVTRFILFIVKEKTGLARQFTATLPSNLQNAHREGNETIKRRSES